MPIPGGLPQELLNKRNVKLGVLDAYIGAEDLAYGAATGWTNVGVIDPASLKTNAPKSLFTLDTGFPATNKITAITMVALDLSFTIHEATKHAVELCLGSGVTAKTYATTPAATTVAAGSTTTTVNLTSAVGYAVGQKIEVGMNAAGTGAEDVYIETLVGTAATVQPPLSVAPTAADTIKALKTYQNAFGSAEVPRNALKIVFSDNYVEVITLVIPGFSPVGPAAWMPSDTKTNAKFPVQLKAYGKSQTWQGKQQSIVGFLYHDFAGVT